MGKSKKRSLHLGINDRVESLSREDAISEVVALLDKRSERNHACSLITLFGLSAEELLESGASYETVMSLQGIIRE